MRLLTGIVALSCIVLTACGGGSSGNATSPTNSPPAPAPPTGSSLPGPRPTVGPQEFVAFESGQVRPLALSADGQRLFALNTPDNRLEIFSTTGGLQLLASVLVGLEPVAVALDPNGQVWVVNHLSDSVSIVDVNAVVPHVVQTLWVGDEPRDIVFAGANRERAFITTAHRGQNSPVDPALNTPSVGRADVWVFDSTAASDTAGGTAEQIITLFGDRPRPLAVSGDGLRVFAGIFLSGNKTTSIAPSNFVKQDPTTSADNVAAPDSGLIVRFNGSAWVDPEGNNRSGFVPFSMPDYDIFEIDAQALTITRQVSGVGTILFNIAANPIDDTLYVSNIDSRNHIRFSGSTSRGNTSVRGHLVDQQITVIGAGQDVRKRPVNKHIDFSVPTGSQAERDLSLATLLDMAITSDGQTLYATAFGSQKLSVFDTAELEDDSFAPAAQNQIELSGGGPSGVVLDETNNLAYVLTRFDNGVSTIDLATNSEVAHINLFNPEPPEITNGRKFLYDARISSGNGNDSCASCHIFGDTDGLAWDLGNPEGDQIHVAVLPFGHPDPEHVYSHIACRLTAPVSSDERAHDHAIHAWAYKPRSDALARRPYRQQSCRRRDARRGRVQGVQRGV